MSKETNKTAPTKVSIEDFLATVSEQRQDESRQLISIMREITGEEPVMWGPSIIGFGGYHYKYESGREGDMPVAAFSPRKPNMVVYLTEDVLANQALLEKLGPHTSSKVCLYIKRLSAVDLDVLGDLIVAASKDVSAGDATNESK